MSAVPTTKYVCPICKNDPNMTTCDLCYCEHETPLGEDCKYEYANEAQYCPDTDRNELDILDEDEET